METTTQTDQGEISEPGSQDIELLALKLGGEDYAIDIMSVREIRSQADPTPLPHAPPFVLGVINLRGTVLPVIDLATRLGLSHHAPETRSVIVVVQHRDRTFGIVVDAVADILSRASSALQSAPDFGSADATCIDALIVEDSQMFRVLDLDAVFAPSIADPTANTSATGA